MLGERAAHEARELRAGRTPLVSRPSTTHFVAARYAQSSDCMVLHVVFCPTLGTQDPFHAHRTLYARGECRDSCQYASMRGRAVPSSVSTE